jgi:hypothetical protein
MRAFLTLLLILFLAFMGMQHSLTHATTPVPSHDRSTLRAALEELLDRLDDMDDDDEGQYIPTITEA